MTSFEVPYIAPKQNYFSEPTHTKKMYFTEANIIEKSFFPVDRQTHLKETGYSEGNNFKNIKYAKQKTDSTTIQYGKLSLW